MDELILHKQANSLIQHEAKTEELLEIKKRMEDMINRDLKGKATVEVKTILALNRIFSREFSQHERFLLTEAGILINHVQERRVLLENNFVLQSSELVGASTVYVWIDPADENIAEAISKAIAPFQEAEIDFELKLYINSTDWNVYELIQISLDESVQVSYELVSTITKQYIKERADQFISALKPGVTVRDLVNAFNPSLGISFRDRNKSILIAAREEGMRVKGLGELDLLLLATKNLPNLLLEEQTQTALASHATNLWFNVTASYKYMHEIIEDYFMAPTIVLLRGLTPVVGIIMDRSLVLSGAFVGSEEEELVEITINDSSRVKSIEADLDTFLHFSVKNLRSRLISYNGRPMRVDKIVPSLVITGRTLTSNNKVSGFVVEGDLTNVTLLSIYYLPQFYEAFSKIKIAVPHKLPDRFTTYLYRKALMRGVYFEPNEVDIWFSQANSRLPDILEKLSEVLNINDFLGSYISGRDGLTSTEILVRSEQLACRTKIS